MSGDGDEGTEVRSCLNYPSGNSVSKIRAGDITKGRHTLSSTHYMFLVFYTEMKVFIHKALNTFQHGPL